MTQTVLPDQLPPVAVNPVCLLFVNSIRRLWLDCTLCVCVGEEYSQMSFEILVSSLLFGYLRVAGV